jgi:dipeptidyl aminopeptidase/acylaminoacyl peptidase
MAQVANAAMRPGLRRQGGRKARRALTALALSFLLAGTVGAEPPKTHLATLADARTIVDVGEVKLGPDGDLVAIEAGGQIHILRLGTDLTELRKLDGHSPSWAPDGQSLAYYSSEGPYEQVFVWRKSTNSGVPVTSFGHGVTPAPLLVLSAEPELSWSPDSSKIAFVSRIIGPPLSEKERAPALTILDKNSSAMAHWDEVFRHERWETGVPDGVSNATLAVAKYPERGLNQLFVVDLKSRAIRNLTPAGRQYFAPAWSPDGKIIAAISDDSRAVEYPGPSSTKLALINATSGTAELVSPPRKRAGPPQWSPDGKALLLLSTDRLIGQGYLDLYDFSAQRWSTIPAPKGYNPVYAIWGPNPRHIVVQIGDHFADTLWNVDIATGLARQMKSAGLVLSHYDVDRFGKAVVAAQNATTKGRIYSVTEDAPPRLIHDFNPQLANIRFGRQLRLNWTNLAGERLDGILILPPDYEPGRRYPMVVDVYPTPGRDRLNLFAIPRMMGQIEAAKGYVVFIPGPRAPHTPSSMAREPAFYEKARGAKGISILVDDFKSGIKYVESLGYSEPGNFCLYGASNGGYAANFLITEISGIRCAIIHEGSSDDIAMHNWFPANGWADEITGVDFYSHFDDYVKMSPLFRMNKVNTSVLLIYGGASSPTWPMEMIAEFKALRDLGKDVTLLRYNEEGHAFTTPFGQDDSLMRIHHFLDRHLQ